jgi:hypothetical protein
MRRLRATEALRETWFAKPSSPGRFHPAAVRCPGEGVRREISSMPGIISFRWSW